jgi:hypothetical protein
MSIKNLYRAAMIVGGMMSLQARIVEDFEGQSASHNYRNDARSQAFELSAAPQSTGQAGKISWDAAKTKYAEVTFKQRAKLPVFDTATVKIKVFAPTGSPVTHFNLRLIDAQGEVFQWNQAVSLRSSGWQDLAFHITPANFRHCWGGKKNKTLDQPAKLFGFGIDYRKGSGKGHLWIDDIRFSSGTGDKVACTSTLASFDETEKWQLRSHGGDGMLSLAKGLNISGAARTFTLTKRKWHLTRQPLPEQLILTAELQSGAGQAVVHFRDAKNKTFSSQPCLLKEGRQSYRIEIEGVALTPPVFVDHLKLTSKSEHLDLKLIGLESRYQDFAIKAIETEVLTGTPVHVLKTGDEQKLRLAFRNIADQPVTFKADIDLENYFGETICFSKKLTLGAGTTREWKMPALPAVRGIWWVNYTLVDLQTEDSSSNGRLSFAYMAPAGPTPEPAQDFLFGMCTHSARWGERDQQLEVLATALCGAKVIRTGPEWGSIQPQKNVWNWQALDQLVDLYGQAGVEIQALLGYCPKWAAPIEKQHSRDWMDWSRGAPDLDAFSRYAYRAAKRYDGRIRYWEVWNEPDIGFFRGTLDEYLAMLKTASDSVKKASPSAKVLTGGFAGMDHPHRKKDFQKQVLVQGEKHVDIHAFHAHGNFSSFARTIDGKFLPMRRENAVRQPWYANETAVTSMDGAQKMQAETLYKKFLFSWSRGAIGYNWYDLRNDGFDPKNGEHNYGLLTNDFYPKAAYPVYNALALFFKKTSFERQLDLGDNLWAFVFKGQNRIIIPAWNEQTASAGKHLVIQTNAKQAEKIDLMGNATPAPLVDGMTILEISPVPAALNLLQVTKAREIGYLLDASSTQVAIPGRSIRCPIALRNPFKSKKSFKVSLVLPNGLSSPHNVKTIAVEPNHKITEYLTLDVSPKLKGNYGKRLEFELAYDVLGTPWKGTIKVPVNLAVSMPAGGFKRPADFAVNKRTDVISLFEADPSKLHLIWKDANDLGASIWLGCDDRNLLLKLAVTDDVHKQEYRGGNVWKGDNVQVGLQIPGQEGFWEIGFSLLQDNTTETFIWGAPLAFDKARVAKSIQLKCSRQNRTTHYMAAIPLANIGASRKTLKEGIRFNLLVNDNDEGVREGWIQVAPGIGTGKNPAKFPFLVFE